MRRRDFIAVVGGAAAWPIAVRGQQAERMRRIGVLMAATADDRENQTRIGAFQQGLAALGWTEGRNARIDTRWATTNADDWHYDRGAVATGDPHRADRVRDCHRPGRPGFVASLARPGGNATVVGLGHSCDIVSACPV